MSAAQERYNKRCPVFSARLTPFLKQIVDQYKWNGESNPSFIKRTILDRLDIENIKKAEYQRGRTDGFWTGVEAGEKTFGLSVPCAQCGQPIYIQCNDEAHRALIEFARINGWRHQVCPWNPYQYPYQNPYWPQY